MYRRRILIVLAIAAVVWPAARVVAQRNGSTNLVLNVVPEARLIPSQIPLEFTVSADGTNDVTSQTTSVSTWVRSLPGQQIHLTASLVSVDGPSGTLPASAVAWTGSVARATAGGQAATCTQGSFANSATQEMVSGWQSSGTLTCAIAMSLGAPRTLAPGVYTATVSLALHAE